MNKKKEVFFGSLFEPHNSINVASMSARIMDNQIKNRVGLKTSGKNT